MSVQAFSFPLPETRFFRAGRHVYKFKIRSGSKCSEEVINGELVTLELEDAVRVVLANLDSLQPFVTKHFNIFPYKSRWERVSELQFQQGRSMLTAYPFLLTLYLETHDGLHAHTAKRSRDWTPVRATEQGLRHLPQNLTCQHKRTRTERPQGGTPTQHTCGAAREPPEGPAGAEAMAGDRRVPERLAAVHTSSASSAVMQREGWESGGAQGESEEPARSAEQGDPEGPGPCSVQRGLPGVLANVARKLFPLSLLFGSGKK